MAMKGEPMYSAKYLSDELNIPPKYLRRLMTLLSKKGFVYANFGRNGGFSFTKNIKDIYLHQIIDAVEDLASFTGCVLGFEQCSDENPCVMHNFWADIRIQTLEKLYNTNLLMIKLNNTKKY
jgi:Rrf2 family protein